MHIQMSHSVSTDRNITPKAIQQSNIRLECHKHTDKLTELDRSFPHL